MESVYSDQLESEVERIKSIISLTLPSDLSLTNKVAPSAPHLDGKKSTDVATITSHFKFQALSNSCYPTCIFNVLKALAISHDYSAIGFSQQRVDKLCGYKQPFGPKLSLVVPNLNKALRSFGYAVYEQVPTTYDGLVKVLGDQESSYPIIGLSYQYLLDRNAVEDLDIPNPPDHTVIVLSCNPAETIIFDTYDARIRTMQGQSDRIGRGLYLIPTSQMTAYWEKAVFGPWAFWVRRRTKESTKSTRLEEYGKYPAAS